MKHEFTDMKSIAESAMIEVLLGNKVVLYEENGKYIMIVWKNIGN